MLFRSSLLPFSFPLSLSLLFSYCDSVSVRSLAKRSHLISAPSRSILFWVCCSCCCCCHCWCSPVLGPVSCAELSTSAFHLRTHGHRHRHIRWERHTHAIWPLSCASSCCCWQHLLIILALPSFFALYNAAVCAVHVACLSLTHTYSHMTEGGSKFFVFVLLLFAFFGALSLFASLLAHTHAHTQAHMSVAKLIMKWFIGLKNCFNID